MTYHNSTLNAEYIQQVSSSALEQGGFAAFYQAQVELFIQHVKPSFNYFRFKNQTQRATQPLSDAMDLLCYNVCYAAAHFARFSHVLGQLQARSRIAPQQKISLKVFDFACGQGLASLALLQHLQGRPVDMELHLVEPSVVALQAAQHYVAILAKKINGTVTVHAHACTLDQLDDGLSQQQDGQRTVFLFSNVLDMAQHNYFDIKKLVRFIRAPIDPALCIAVSPKFISGERGFVELQEHLPIYHRPVDGTIEVSTPSYRLQQGWQTQRCEGRALAFLSHAGIYMEMDAPSDDCCAVSTTWPTLDTSEWTTI